MSGETNHNPCKHFILSCLQAQARLSEFELLQALRLNEGFGDLLASLPQPPEQGDVHLFREHFIIMNALYALQDELSEEGLYLSISALEISLSVSGQAAETYQLERVGADAKLKAYYLDWQQLLETDAAQLESWLSGFWQRYCAVDKRYEALLVLGLDKQHSGLDSEQLRKRYRQLAARHHPDKGGEATRFIEIRQAFELLSALY